MSPSDFEALTAAASRLLEQAKADPALAERLLAAPGATIAAAAGRPLPEGIRITAEREADGSIALATLLVSAELPDDALDTVAGGKGTPPRR